MIPILLRASRLTAAIYVGLPHNIGNISERHELGRAVRQLAGRDLRRVIG